MPQLKSTKKKPATTKPPHLQPIDAVRVGPFTANNQLPDQLTVKDGKIVFKHGRVGIPAFTHFEGKTVTVCEREQLQGLLDKCKIMGHAYEDLLKQRDHYHDDLAQRNAASADLIVKQSALVEQVEQLERQLRDERCARGALELAIQLLGKGLGTR